MRGRTRKTAPPEAAATATCPRCGHEHRFATHQEFMSTTLDMPCPGCGFLFLEWMDRRMAAMQGMMAQDPQWVEWVQAGKLDVLEKRLDALVPPPERRKG